MTMLNGLWERHRIGSIFCDSDIGYVCKTTATEKSARRTLKNQMNQRRIEPKNSVFSVRFSVAVFLV
jgi:hypothetical protein